MRLCQIRNHKQAIRILFLVLIVAITSSVNGQPERKEDFLSWAQKLSEKTGNDMQGVVGNEMASKAKCSMAVGGINDAEEQFPKIMGFITLSLPKQILIEMSKQLERVGGVFVIRGIPKNSFRELSKKVTELRESGVCVTILIDPKGFETHNITQVPTIVIMDREKSDKIAGNISIDFALRKFAEEGEAKTAARSLLSLSKESP